MKEDKVAFAASGAGHQYGGGQYKSSTHHGRLSKMGLMAQMSDSQLLSYAGSLQDIKEEEENSETDISSKKLHVKQFLDKLKKKRHNEEKLPSVKENNEISDRCNRYINSKKKRNIK